MKLIYTVILAACSTSVYAISTPPALDTSSTYRTAKASSSAASTASSTTLAGKVNKLQADVAQLKVKLNDLAKKQNTINANFDKRLDDLGSVAVTPSLSVAAPADTSSLDVPAVSEAHATASAGEKSSYNTAYATYKQGNYTQAIQLFQAQVNAYPNGEYADNAYYWIGEAYLRKGNKTTALQMFNKVANDFPQGGKAPDALLKMAITQLSLGKKANAKQYFDFLINNYPNTASASKALIKKEQAGL